MLLAFNGSRVGDDNYYGRVNFKFDSVELIGGFDIVFGKLLIRPGIRLLNRQRFDRDLFNPGLYGNTINYRYENLNLFNISCSIGYKF